MGKENNEVVIITGATGGLGRSLVKTFASHGSRIVVHYLSQRKKAEELVSYAKAKGVQSFSFRADLKNQKEIVSLCERTLKTFEKINILIHAASIVSDKRIARLSEKEWDEVISVNLTGTFRILKNISHFLVKQGSGHIINISSYAGVHGRIGQANYAASKAGLIGLTKTAAKELGPQNIQVNTVIPGLLNAGMGKKISPAQFEKIRKEFLLPTQPPISQIAEFIHTLAYMEGISGQIFNLDSRVIF